MTPISELVFEALKYWCSGNEAVITYLHHPEYRIRIGNDTLYLWFETVHEVEQWIERYEGNNYYPL